MRPPDVKKGASGLIICIGTGGMIAECNCLIVFISMQASYVRKLWRHFKVV